jgi:two-component system, cell cycle response regulator
VPSDDDAKTRVTGKDARPPSASGEDCLVVIHTAVQTDFGRRHVLKTPLTTIGRGRDNDIVVLSDAVSRHHAKLERRGTEFLVSDLDSTNGTFVNSEPKPLKEWRLNRGDQLRIGDTIFKYLSGADIENQYHAVIAHMAMMDGLTNLCNRKQLDTVLMEEIGRAQRHGRHLSLMMLDIDHFKRVNDAHGHLAGDGILSRLGLLLQQRLRPSDKVGRYGGEEFCAILPETTLARATSIAETLRTMIAEEQFITENQTLAVTVSIGVAAFEPRMQYADLYRAADQLLYQAKRLGRNQVCSGQAPHL